MQTLKSFFSIAGLLSLLACVTVNVYFPEAAAEQALRGVARDILDVKPAEAPVEPRASLGLYLGRILTAWVPTAEAADQPDVNVQTPAALKLRTSLKQRQAKLDPYYRSGAIGLSANFKPVPRDLGLVPLQERVALKKLLSDDGQDRTALFGEVARANGHPEWEKNLQETFDRVFFEEVPRGYWYQDAQGSWRQK